VLCLDPGSAAGFEEFGKSFVLEAANHAENVYRNVSGVNLHNA
jgi:hypothetical protein